MMIVGGLSVGRSGVGSNAASANLVSPHTLLAYRTCAEMPYQ
ncbi:MAG: hypothetical protein ACYS3S_04345 [Planctomycetota bacterium]